MHCLPVFWLRRVVNIIRKEQESECSRSAVGRDPGRSFLDMNFIERHFCFNHLPDSFQFFRCHAAVCDKEHAAVNGPVHTEGGGNVFFPHPFPGAEENLRDTDLSLFKSHHNMCVKYFRKISDRFRNLTPPDGGESFKLLGANNVCS